MLMTNTINGCCCFFCFSLRWQIRSQLIVTRGHSHALIFSMFFCSTLTRIISNNKNLNKNRFLLPFPLLFSFHIQAVINIPVTFYSIFLCDKLKVSAALTDVSALHRDPWASFCTAFQWKTHWRHSKADRGRNVSPASVINIRASLRSSGASSSEWVKPLWDPVAFPPLIFSSDRPPALRRAPSLEERSLAACRVFLISRASAGADRRRRAIAFFSAGRGVTANLWRRSCMKAASVAVPSGSVIQPYVIPAVLCRIDGSLITYFPLRN